MGNNIQSREAMNVNLSLYFLLSGTSPLTVMPTTGLGKELMEEGQRRKGEQEAQFQLIFKVYVIETWCLLCSAVKPSGKLNE